MALPTVMAHATLFTSIGWDVYFAGPCEGQDDRRSVEEEEEEERGRVTATRYPFEKLLRVAYILLILK
jgi:hypothetical protein